MDPIQLIQASLVGLLQGGQQTANTTAGTNATAIGAGPSTPLPLNFSSILSFLLSLAALREWLKLIVIGGIIETSRRGCLKLWAVFVESFWLTACFDENDLSYTWALYWLSQQPTWNKARIIDITTRSFGLNSPAISVYGDEESEEGRKLSYLPSFSKTYTVWFKGHYVRVTRSQIQEGVYSTREVLHFDILARNHSVLNALLLEAKNLYGGAQAHLISVFVSESAGNWRHVASRPKRPMKSIVLDPGMKDLLLDDAKDFLQSEEWYAERGIPFRRGYLLYGAPGSGKTSMIHSLAGELGLDVYIISLSRAGLDDTALSALISELPRRCIALMEDIDAAFHHGLTRDLDDESDKKEDDGEEHKKHDSDREKEKASVSSPLSRVTLSGLLNALDGVGAQEGRILYATTNRYSALDPALCRPGRMDLHVEFRLASKYQARELFKCFYLPSHSDDNSKDEDEEPVKSETDDHDSAYGSGSSNGSPAPSVDGETEEMKPLQLYEGERHRSAGPRLSYRRVAVLAERFADAIPERELSMASLQGYLMSYKIRPIEAAEAIVAWVAHERAEKAKKHRVGKSSP
ncbi:P-loop containing nucleoside triphosphate hydrolase protein [Irpex rosettiformis]|uniref:P-loop containing nucleoside triphosphate hydrolase protein n=1 Tax=Irpex rosettiformis TaxID=378272 RepID=A0ACB8UBC9_9APHY|nr:P-loop containing nucleoside triphosphate hydrolase protein [Irpex rosettiformis]